MAIRDGCAMGVGDKVAVYQCLKETLSKEHWASLLAAPVELAVCTGDILLLRSLMLSGASASSTALDTAVKSGYLGMMRTLLQYGADVKSVKADGSTILHVAVSMDRVDAIHALLEAGANVNAQDLRGQTPLFIASGKSSPRTVKALCQGGANRNQPDNYGWTPLHVAVQQSRSLSSVETLLDAGAVGDPRTSHENWSALDLAARIGDVGMIRALVQHGVNVNAADSTGRTSMHDAARHDMAAAIHALAEAGAFPNTRDSTGRTPIHIAAECHAAGAVRALVQNGAWVDVQDYHGRLPLHRATRTSEDDSGAEVVDILLRWDADETAKNAQGRTPAEVAGWEAVFLRETTNVRLLQLLDNAPADRASRLRSFLALYRAYPDRVQLRVESDQEPADDTERRKKSPRIDAGPDNDEAGGADAGVVDDVVPASDTGSLVTAIVGLKKDKLFRRVLAFL